MCLFTRIKASDDIIGMKIIKNFLERIMKAKDSIGWLSIAGSQILNSKIRTITQCMSIYKKYLRFGHVDNTTNVLLKDTALAS